MNNRTKLSLLLIALIPLAGVIYFGMNVINILPDINNWSKIIQEKQTAQATIIEAYNQPAKYANGGNVGINNQYREAQVRYEVDGQQMTSEKNVAAFEPIKGQVVTVAYDTDNTAYAITEVELQFARLDYRSSLTGAFASAIITILIFVIFLFKSTQNKLNTKIKNGLTLSNFKK
jgi:hypothetical protein